jgi:hypothetical protein
VQIFVVFCFMVVTTELLILNLRSLIDSNDRTRASVVGGFDCKSAITDIVQIQNFEVLTFTEFSLYYQQMHSLFSTVSTKTKLQNYFICSNMFRSSWDHLQGVFPVLC